MLIQAEILTGSGPRVPIGSRWLRIGRDADNQIVLEQDSYVSRFHAWIVWEQGKFFVEDLGSTNGTLLNGEPPKGRELLSAGDSIKTGDSEMTFVLLGKTSLES